MNQEDRDYLIDTLRSGGLAPVGVVEKNEAYGLYIKKTSELLPIFIPNIQSIRKVKILTGVIAVATRSKSVNIIRYSPVISTHCSNFPKLSYLHEFRKDRLSDMNFVMIVANILSKLPVDRAGIQTMIEQHESVEGVSILDMIHQE